jgi:hypothetical protein
MKICIWAARTIGAVLLFAIVCAAGTVGCRDNNVPKPMTEEEKQKVNEQMQKLQEKANKKAKAK